MGSLNIIIEASARHVHVSKEDLAVLFGAGYALRNKRDLSQPGEFLTEEKLRLEGPKGAIDRVSILGPERPRTQVEISLTDARALGVEAPVRGSGDVAGSPGVTLVGPAGRVELKEGVIAAMRHLHLTPETAEAHGLRDKQTVSLKVDGPRGLTFGQVLVRVSPKFVDRCHIDYDEANAAGISGEITGEVL